MYGPGSKGEKGEKETGLVVSNVELRDRACPYCAKERNMPSLHFDVPYGATPSQAEELLELGMHRYQGEG